MLKLGIRAGPLVLHLDNLEFLLVSVQTVFFLVGFDVYVKLEHVLHELALLNCRLLSLCCKPKFFIRDEVLSFLALNMSSCLVPNALRVAVYAARLDCLETLVERRHKCCVSVHTLFSLAHHI